MLCPTAPHGVPEYGWTCGWPWFRSSIAPQIIDIIVQIYGTSGGANDSGDQLSLVTVSDPACQARIAAQFLQTSGPEVLS